MTRDEFRAPIKKKLAERVNYHCSDPDCRAPTIGPHTDEEKSTSLGIAAHICAAAPGGPRFDAAMTPTQRKSIRNGIWLCVPCSVKIDRDEARYPATLLRTWKQQAEARALAENGRPAPVFQASIQLTSTFTPRTWQADSIGRFHFSARATEVIGRNAEFAALLQFCMASPERVFSWWLMTGKGGMGKSRLAYELGSTLATQCPAWDWQFLGNDAVLKKNLAILAEGTWQPQRPTLLIVDYAATVADELRATLLGCIAASTRLGHCVRLLVIERTLDGGWYEKLLGGTSANDNLLVRESAYHPQPLALPALSLAHGLAILQGVLNRYDNTTTCNLDELLNKLDVEHRPLFILFLADALHQGGTQVKWDSGSLISEVLTRELARWSAQGVLEVDKKLLCFATLAGDIDLAEALPPYVEGLMETAEEVTSPPFAERMAIALMDKHDGKFIPKLEPDLLGELFVLETLDLAETARQKKAASDQALFEAAWRTGLGLGTLAFITRAVQDFPQHKRLGPLVERFAAFCAEESVEGRLLAMLYFNLCNEFGNHGDMARAEAWFTKLSGLSARYAASESMALEHAKAAVNLGNFYGNAGQAEQVRAILDNITNIATRFPTNHEIALANAKAAFNLGNFYLHAGQTEQVRAMLDIIGNITTRFPTNHEIALRHAQAAFNLGTAYGQAKQAKQARAMLDIIANIATRLPTNHEIALAHAQAAFNLAYFYTIAGQAEQAHAMLELIKGLLQQFPDHPGFIELRDVRLPRLLAQS